MKSIAILGLLVAIIPFLGIPGTWKTFLFFVIGLTIFAKAFLIFKKEKNKNAKNNSNSVFKQNDLIEEEYSEADILE